MQSGELKYTPFKKVRDLGDLEGTPNQVTETW